MSARQTLRRLEKLQERFSPESDDCCTLEELCRSFWQKDEKGFRKLANEYSAIRYWIPQFEREGRGE